MSSTSDKRTGEAGAEQIPQKLLDLIQPLAKEDRKDTPDQLPLQQAYGNAAVAQTLIQRKEGLEVQSETTSETAPAEITPDALTAFIVDDHVDALGPGQMKKSDFLAALKAAVCGSAAEALANTQWSAIGCPYIERWFSHYGNQSSAYIEKAIRRYAPETAAGTSASSYIPAIAARVRRSVTTWANTGEITGVPPGVSVPDIGSMASAGLSNVAGAVSSGVASAVSGVANLLFKEDEGGAAEHVDPQAVQNRLGAGQSLDASVRTRMEQAFGESFSGVQVHTDNNAAHVSENLNARALTVGNHIAFARGEYQPGNPIGDALLAHELSHVLQQRGAGQSTQRNDSGSSNTSALEQAADQSAVAAVLSLWGGQRLRAGNVARNAMPRLRSGLKLSRCGDKKQPARSPTREPIPPDPHAEYEKRLKEAVDKLKGVDFGLCYEGPEKFDTDYWIAEEDPEWGRRLTLKAGKRASDAIDAMFADLGKWRVDCAQFVQVAEWYALRHAYGSDEFDRRVGSTVYLKVHRSTGISYKELYSRPNKFAKMTRRSDGREESKSVEDLLRDAPVGSRITWTNKMAPMSSAFRNENTIKLGPDSFAAHGFSTSKNIFTRAEVELLLAQAESPSADAAYIAANIFLSQIGYFETP